MLRRIILPLALAGLAGCGAARFGNQRADLGRDAAGDRALRAALHAALDGSGRSEVEAYAFLGRVFLVGFVRSDAERDALVAAARAVRGVHIVHGYLPSRPADGGDPARDQAMRAVLAAALARAGVRPPDVETQVLDGHAVLLGVVGSAEAAAAAVAAARATGGVRGVRSFLLVRAAVPAGR